MKLQNLLEKLQEFPTIMSFQQELEIISSILSFSDDELLEDTGTLIYILDIIYESHTGGTIFEVNDSNKEGFHKFADRLCALAKKMPLKSKSEMLLSVARAIDTTFQI